MILALDIGNTNIVLGCVDKDNKVSSLFRIKTDISRTSWQYAVEINSMLDMYKLNREQFSGCIISSVVPPLTSVIKTAVKQVTDMEPMVVGPGMKTGLNIALDNPASMGSDRVVDAVATINNYKLPAVIIDTGTATTISVIDENKNYLGGMIIPGIMISQEALTSRTSQLPKISLEPPKTNKIIGKNTIDCMKSGAVYGNAAMIDAVVSRIEEELCKTVTVIATGGLASSIMPYCKREGIIIDNNLLLKGLRILYDKNKQ
ncbi:MAG: type III pantothenate kinase [Acutalibacteraceae bacterium]|nr:type III pantothenate kinase [Acutalibacteraceae bacterium]